MKIAPYPENEHTRLAALRDLAVLDTGREAEFDALVHVASLACGMPISLLSLVDQERQWFKANVGLPDAKETPRDLAFCAHAILEGEALEVCDAREDQRFADNPLVTGGPEIQYYCGAPVVLSDGHRVGTLCVIDRIPRKLDARQREILEGLALAAASALEGRRASLEVSESNERLRESDTQLRVTIEQLNRANSDLSAFIGIASHDLRSPLRGIHLLAGWIAEELGDQLTGPVEEHLTLMRSRIRRMEALLTDLREYTTLGHHEGEFVEVDTHELVTDIFDLHRADSGATLEVDAALPVMPAHRAPLELVLRNLISNAIKHGPRTGARISVGAEQGEDFVKFSVMDNGPGIDPKYRESVFDMFRTLQPRDQNDGSGVGLALVKKTVELGGGTVWIDAAADGGGAFHFTWPTANAASPSHAAA